MRVGILGAYAGAGAGAGEGAGAGAVGMNPRACAISFRMNRAYSAGSTPSSHRSVSSKMVWFWSRESFAKECMYINQHADLGTKASTGGPWRREHSPLAAHCHLA